MNSDELRRLLMEAACQLACASYQRPAGWLQESAAIEQRLLDAERELRESIILPAGTAREPTAQAHTPGEVKAFLVSGEGWGTYQYLVLATDEDEAVEIALEKAPARDIEEIDLTKKGVVWSYENSPDTGDRD